MSETIIKRAINVIEEAESRGIILRLLGALAFRLRSPSAQKYASDRPLSDIDFFGYSRQRSNIERLLKDLEFTPHVTFNMLHGKERLRFHDEKNNFVVDVFFDKFKMCHVFDLRGRLELDRLTLPLADLLMTKLQIVHLTEKDFRDIICLLNDYGLTSSDQNPDLININYISMLCANDWGIYKTFTININKVMRLLDDGFVKKEDYPNTEPNLKKIKEIIESTPKSLNWKLRAKIGEKRRWYSIPDEATK
ncbi:MAG: hypothetical protein ACUVRA_08035 [Candidatus Bathyarchaeaceae archaeon]